MGLTMKLLLAALLLTLNLSAASLGPVTSEEGHYQVPFKMTPNMGSCPFTMLIGGYEQKCYGYGVMDGSGPSGIWYHCSLHASHKWISKSAF